MASRRRVERIVFRSDDRSSLDRRAEAIAENRQGWLNIRPEVEPDDEPPEPGLISGIFAFMGPAVPVGTWIPGKHGPRGDEPDSVGLLHPHGQLLASRLDDLGIPAPEAWRVVQDHPRRGLVFRIPPGYDIAAVLDWLVSACEKLTVVPPTGRWVAEVHGAPQ